MKNTALLFALTLILAPYSSAQSPLMWGQGQWGVNTWSADAGESPDTDGDGIGNNADTDDDDDGVVDSDDAFPLDANESLDTDSDGIGNNADTDDDGDGYTDQHELEMGSDPLDSGDMPRSGGLSPALLRVISQGVTKDDGGGFNPLSCICHATTDTKHLCPPPPYPQETPPKQ